MLIGVVPKQVPICSTVMMSWAYDGDATFEVCFFLAAAGPFTQSAQLVQAAACSTAWDEWLLDSPAAFLSLNRRKLFNSCTLKETCLVYLGLRYRYTLSGPPTQ